MASTQTSVIVSDEEGVIWSLINYAHYFYKSDLSPQEIAAAEATLAGKKEETRASSHQMTPPAILVMPQMRKRFSTSVDLRCSLVSY